MLTHPPQALKQNWPAYRPNSPSNTPSFAPPQSCFRRLCGIVSWGKFQRGGKSQILAPFPNALINTAYPCQEDKESNGKGASLTTVRLQSWIMSMSLSSMVYICSWGKMAQC